MDRSSKPIHETWYLKALVILLGIGVIYAGQIQYEKGIADSHRKRSSRTHPQPPEIEVVQQLDFAGKTLAERRKLLAAMVPVQRANPVDAILGSLRGVVYVRLSQPQVDNPIDEQNILTQSPDELAFEIDSASEPPIAVYPVASRLGNMELIPLPHTSARGIDSPRLCIKDGDKVVRQAPLSNFRPLPTEGLGELNQAPPLALTTASANPGASFVKSFLHASDSPFALSVRPPAFSVRLTRAVPSGERAYVRLIRTEFGPEEEDPAWHELVSSETSLYSPIGPMASQAEVELVYCRPRHVEETVQVPIGQIAVQFGQPILIRAKPESVALSPLLSLKVPSQGVLLKRPSEHPKRAILILGSVLSTGGPNQIPDSLTRIKWIAPTPAALGLDAIWFPWGSVYAPAPQSSPMKDGPLTAILHVSLLRWDVTKRETLVLRIQNPPK